MAAEKVRRTRLPDGTIPTNAVPAQERRPVPALVERSARRLEGTQPGPQRQAGRRRA